MLSLSCTVEAHATIFWFLGQIFVNKSYTVSSTPDVTSSVLCRDSVCWLLGSLGERCRIQTCAALLVTMYSTYLHSWAKQILPVTILLCTVFLVKFGLLRQKKKFEFWRVKQALIRCRMRSRCRLSQCWQICLEAQLCIFVACVCTCMCVNPM